jgi:hypothetical protein
MYENVVMIDLPNFHDGYFDGLWTSENKVVHLFLRTSNGERSTIVLSEVERLYTTNFTAGNIILDVVVVKSDDLTIAAIEQLYQLQPAQAELAQQLLSKAQRRGLLTLEINPSYGAECVALFREAEILPNYVLPSNQSR